MSPIGIRASVFTAAVSLVLPGACGAEKDVSRQEARRLTIYTHCGVWSAVVDGRLWLADPPLHDGSHNPPPGWGLNGTRGTWQVLENGRGRFRSDSGKVAQFVRARPGQQDPVAGCE